MRKKTGLAVSILGAGLLLAQTVRIDRSNPPVRSDIAADPSVRPLLRRACYNCHSNETVWPWYSNVAPVAWLVGSDVKEARRHLDFSEWGTYSSEMRHVKLMEIADEIRGDGMPPWYYSLLHPESRLTGAERNKILDWTAAMLESINPQSRLTEKQTGNAKK